MRLLSVLKMSFAGAMAVGTAVNAAPIVTAVSFLTDRYAPNSVPGFERSTVTNQTQWNVQLISTDPSSLVTVLASHPSFSTFSLFFSGEPIFSNYLFSRNSVFFSPAGLLAFAGNPVPWSYTATDSTGPTTAPFPLIADPELLPFAFNIQASDHSATPTISWMLPDLSAFDVDRLRLRAIDAADGSQIFQTSLSSSATSFTLPSGALQSGHSYYYRVMIEDLEDGLMENRSNAFSAVATSVPEPGTIALVAFALSGVGFFRRRHA